MSTTAFQGDEAASLASTPTFTNDQIADQLTTGYWQANGRPTRSFDVGSDGVLSVNLSGLTNKGAFYAYYALQLWSDVTGIEFVQTRGTADITFDDNDSGAYAYSDLSGNTITASYVNVSTSWISRDGYDLNNYSFQTYVHEIGHALGLGHAGNYNGSADYGIDNDYTNDSWQASIMSYFSQTENTSIDATFAYALTPQVADIIAIQNLYGTTGTTRTGDTVYGDGADSGDALAYITRIDEAVTFTVLDDGGYDTFNFSSVSQDQVINLNEEAISSVRGHTGNMMIARGTEIEAAVGGSGDDVIIGNALDNTLEGGGGNDTLIGGAGADVFVFDATTQGFGDRDTIVDFEDGIDTILIDDGSSFSTASFDLLEFLSSGLDTSISWGNSTITLENVSIAQLDQSDFAFA
ncbi:M10 family metallopeptidase [Pseudovibrio sp. SPO723]|uniref:M10 family metallopeptidase n=1 Tax=Nesiotobacter zosterae TaxID=392721 RepID=UPI0029C49BEE|nr:M10 family metallopeptidase [Pseudovibrio sp. SPO723]MDX5591960.1 M10 family metallopeptidase [Pseudovibrio sp. SPO723]